MARPLARDGAAVSTLWSFLGVLLLVAAILGVYYGLLAPRFADAPIRVLPGDQVQVNYIGTFADTGLVFDTSLESVAQDNATFPKAVSFVWRPSVDQRWEPLSFTVGSGQVVKGFDQGVQGMAIGDTKVLVLPPDLAYGPINPAELLVKPLLESVPVRQTMNHTEFLATYGATAVSGLTVRDPFWGWDAHVSVAGTVITVTNSPVPGQSVRPHGLWDARVESVDDAADGGQGVILVRHLLEPRDEGRIAFKSGGEVVWFLSDVDPDAGTYTQNFNREVVGRTLVFQVTVVDIGRLF